MSTKANIVLEQGCDFNVPITLTDQNGEALVTTEFSANAEMRKYYNATNYWAFSCNLSNGSLLLSMSADVSANIEAGRYVYDVVLTNDVSNTVSRLVEGIVTVTPAVTK